MEGKERGDQCQSARTADEQAEAVLMLFGHIYRGIAAQETGRFISSGCVYDANGETRIDMAHDPVQAGASLRISSEMPFLDPSSVLILLASLPGVSSVCRKDYITRYPVRGHRHGFEAWLDRSDPEALLEEFSERRNKD